MAALLDELSAMGCDIDEAMERFLNNEAFYRKCLGKFLVDDVFAMLEQALKEQNVEESFNHAHNLKGVCSNLGITPMYAVVFDIVEELREGRIPVDVMEKYQQIVGIRDKIKFLLEQE